MTKPVKDAEVVSEEATTQPMPTYPQIDQAPPPVRWASLLELLTELEKAIATSHGLYSDRQLMEKMRDWLEETYADDLGDLRAERDLIAEEKAGASTSRSRAADRKRLASRNA